MNITDIQQCADFYQANYIETFYLVITYSGKSFILIGEKENFPHLMGIPKNIYRSNGYRNPRTLYNDILSRNPVNTMIIPNNIATTSKMYNKVLNFRNSTDIFWKNSGPLTINFNPALSHTHLNNVDVLLTDISTGYMLGWVSNANIPVNGTISIEKFCISTWIDESNGSTNSKEKYLPNQDMELIRNVYALDSHSKLIRHKEYKYDFNQKKNVLQICKRNNSNLLLDSKNTNYYVSIATSENIHCKINGTQY